MSALHTLRCESAERMLRSPAGNDASRISRALEVLEGGFDDVLRIRSENPFPWRLVRLDPVAGPPRGGTVKVAMTKAEALEGLRGTDAMGGLDPTHYFDAATLDAVVEHVEDLDERLATIGYALERAS